VLEILHWITVSILIIFNAELLLKFLVFGFKYFVHSWMHSLDALIVVSSLVLTVVLKGKAQEAVSLLILLRFWRIVRLVDALLVALSFQHEKEKEKMESELKQLREEVKALKALKVV